MNSQQIEELVECWENPNTLNLHKTPAMILVIEIRRLRSKIKHLEHVCPECGFGGSNLYTLPEFLCSQCGYEVNDASN